MKISIMLVVIALPLVSRSQPVSVVAQLAEGARANADSKWDAAIAAYQLARTAARAAGDTKSESMALTGMAETEIGRRRDDLAEKLARESLALAEPIDDQCLIEAALRVIGKVLHRRGQYRELLTVTERKLAIQRALGDRNRIAAELNNMGDTWRSLGDQLLAIDYFTQAAEQFATLGNDRSRGVVLNNIALVYGELGDYKQAMDFGRKALALSEAAKDPEHITTAINGMAVVETWRGNYSVALRLYQQAFEAGRRDADPWTLAEMTNNIGLVYQAQQNHEQAVAYFKKSLEMNRSIRNKSLAAEAHTNLGTEMLALNRLPEAVQQFRQAVQVAREASLPAMESESHRGMGGALFRMRRMVDAEAELQHAAEVQRRIPDLPNLAQTLTELSHLKLAQGHAAEALAQSRESMKLLSSIDMPETLWQAHLAAGHALEQLGRNQEAAAEFESSIATIESLRSRVVGPPTALPIYFANKSEPYQEAAILALARGRTDQALQLVEQSKSRALIDILLSGRAELDKSLTPSEREAERRLETRLVSLNLQIASQPDQAPLKTDRNRTRRELDALQSDLYAAHPEMAFQRGSAPALTSTEISQLAADTHAVILNYFVTPQNSYVFVIRPGAPTRAVTLGAGQAALSARAVEFHRQLSEHDLNFAASARELYRLLLAPVQSDLSAQQAVIILPDGPLWDVAFHALQPAPGRFAIQQNVVSYAPSMAVLRETLKLAADRGAVPAGRELLALGNSAGQQPLPEAERQVREIEKLYGARQSQILTGAAASTSRFKAESAGYRVIHLASHAVLDSVNPMYSYALLARSTDDAGTLAARDLMQLNLRADLLVLSGCETARGRGLGGEGISGMLWAAFVAGAPTTIASMWRVESASTSDLMIGFHRNWLETRRSGDPSAKAGALQKAALSLIAGGKYSHPFYWAGFVLVGSPR